MAAWVGPAIGAAANVIGGLFGRDAQKDANAANAAAAAQNIKMQKEFAQKGIRWRVEDAREAGIHPLYALGAQTASFSPVNVGAVAETGLASGIANAGQDISRAVNATRTQPERDAAVSKTIQDLQLTKAGLENELLASQIAKLKSSINPPMPTIGGENVSLPEGKLDDRTPLVAGHKKLNLHPGWSDGQTFEDRWGEWGGSAAGLGVMIADLLNHARSRTTIERAPYQWWPTIEWKGGRK